MKPLVSVICLCYNHEKFVEKALLSVVNQTYSNVEIIVVDDCSTDKSSELIMRFLKTYQSIKFIQNEANVGNCISFNKALAIANGDFIVDFATDDILKKDKLELQVNAFEQLDNSYGVVFTNAEIINENGDYLMDWYDRGVAVSDGYVFEKILKKSYISASTMLVRREVFDFLGGYDERLAYEDFDFWVRSSQKFKYYYLSDKTIEKRIVSRSLSAKADTKIGYTIIASTLNVCAKAWWLLKNETEKQALKKRIYFEMRHALMIEAFDCVLSYYSLLKEMNDTDIKSRLIKTLAELKIPLYYFYKIYKGGQG
ncbi:family 2 glycosyl transferase [Sporocytophaga myxococcoides]|uniref:Family 2 glycosyl transferase n=1 Tax=Sporocytophaga myxococcoides TaxID=153721 RepID=A0A098L8V3_9BACT|nr:glycosyltransferase [Sporocytophaga myxococcoides]GAL83002.1 family 2 glycosyl transferase [Sporocytophaga myxococcoides]